MDFDATEDSGKVAVIYEPVAFTAVIVTLKAREGPDARLASARSYRRLATVQACMGYERYSFTAS